MRYSLKQMLYVYLFATLLSGFLYRLTVLPVWFESQQGFYPIICYILQIFSEMEIFFFGQMAIIKSKGTLTYSQLIFILIERYHEERQKADDNSEQTSHVRQNLIDFSIPPLYDFVHWGCKQIYIKECRVRVQVDQGRQHSFRNKIAFNRLLSDKRQKICICLYFICSKVKLGQHLLLLTKQHPQSFLINRIGYGILFRGIQCNVEYYHRTSHESSKNHLLGWSSQGMGEVALSQMDMLKNKSCASKAPFYPKISTPSL